MSDPHGDATVVTAGTDLENASSAVVAIHGRGATARSVVDLVAQAADRGAATDRSPAVDPGSAGDGDAGDSHAADGTGPAILAPQANRNTWYPNSFMAPLDANEPHLSSALGLVDDVVDRAASAVGTEHVVLLGFSQGACLATEFLARNPTRYGGLAALSGGRIGPESVEWDDEATLAAAERDLDETPAFFGCSDVDPHIPEDRVHESADSLERLGADPTVEIYPGMGHTVNEDELDRIAALLATVGDD